jgi:hypothetical protein
MLGRVCAGEERVRAGLLRHCLSFQNWAGLWQGFGLALWLQSSTFQAPVDAFTPVSCPRLLLLLLLLLAAVILKPKYNPTNRSRTTLGTFPTAVLLPT